MRASISSGLALAISCCLGCAHGVDCVSKASDGIKSGRAETALQALERGARRGDERCKFILGMWSLSGTGMKPDPVSGIRWVSEAAKDGLPVAQSSLGLLYASGWGVEKDEEAAAEWYRAAADYGDPLGQAALGAVTFLGIGVPKNPVEVYMWTSLAAAQGNEKARTYLPAMERAMTTDEIEQAKARVAEFRPKERPEPKQRRVGQPDLYRAVGLHGPPTEYERFFGY